MALTREHDLHRRRWGRNLGLALTLGAFIVLVFWLTIAKVQNGGRMQGWDHTYQPEADPATRLPAPTDSGATR
jgi:ferric-dicitrate binding protein FerR (iron transport regulator)